MSDARETRVFYKAIADFAALRRELRQVRSELAKTQAAEAAFNASSAKDRAAATKASNARTKALREESKVVRDTNALASKHATSTNKQTTSSRSATQAIQAQNRALLTNIKRLTEAAAASKLYSDAQKKISGAVGPSNASVKALQNEVKALKQASTERENHTRAIREEAIAQDRAKQSSVEFVDGVGKVNKTTGEVVGDLKDSEQKVTRWSQLVGRAIETAKSFRDNTITESAEVSAARQRENEAAGRVRVAETRLSELRAKYAAGSSQVVRAEEALVTARNRLKVASERTENALVRFRDENGKLVPVFRKVEQGSERLYSNMQKFANWRPHLIPPFVALVPIIAGLLSLLNPLVALLGSVGGAAIGLAGSIGSLAGAFLALPGILSGVASGLAAVIVSMGGVGAVFKAYSAMQKATNSAGGGSTGESQAERAYQLAKAEKTLEKAQKNVQKAQENLNKAREKALEDLIKLRLEVSRAGMDEERAIANLRKAQEEYWNVLADPGSTLGDKLDAAASVKEAEASLQDVRTQNIQNQKDLTEAEKKGIEGSDQVVQAKENLADAYDSVADAQHNLTKTQKGETAATVKAANDFQNALDKLSPSAQRFVLALIGMQDQWNEFRKDIQEAFFSQFIDDMDRLPAILKNVANFLRPAAVAMGIFTKNLIEMLSSPEWSKDMATIGDQNGRVLDGLGRAVIALADALKDIVIAAGPFTDWMINGFAQGTENFAKFIKTSRETGSLADWLTTVKERMEKWWAVVKNVGATIFNYSSAAQDFGGWLLDGLVKMTEGWKKASENATKDGSPFKKYLEDIKPLLKAVNDLLGSFFGWFSRESMDPQNIKDATDLLTKIKDDLGPALSKLFDALSKSHIDQKFVDALSSIVESISTIVDSGGGAGFASFFDVVDGFFKTLADVIKKIDPGTLTLLMKFLGFMAGATFVGQFSGATFFISALLGLGGKAGLIKNLTSLFKSIPGIGAVSFTGVLGFLGKLLKVGGVAGAIVSVLGGLADVGGKSYNIADKLSKGDTKGAQKDLTNVDNGLLFTENPLAPAGTPGANPLAALSSGAGFIDSIFGTDTKSQLQKTVDDIINGWTQSFSAWMKSFSQGWTSFWSGQWLTDGWNSIVAGWNNFWATMGDPKFWAGLGAALGDFIIWLGGQWDFFWKQVGDNWTSFWAGIGQAWSDFWAWFGGFVDSKVKEFQYNWDNFWGGIKAGWDTFWGLFSTGELWSVLGDELNRLGAGFKSGWDTFWSGLKSGFDTVVTNLKTAWNGIRSAFAEPVNFVINRVWNGGIVPFWNGLAGKLGWNTLSNANPIQYAEGGVLPGYTPGRDVHEFYSPTGGRLSLSGGEAIMRPEFVKMVGGKEGIAAINKKAKSGQAFANGGVWGSSGSNKLDQKDSRNRAIDLAKSKAGVGDGNGLVEIAGDIWDSLGSFFSNPFKYVTDGISDLVGGLLGDGALTGNTFGQMIADLPRKAIEGLSNLASTDAKKLKRKQPAIAADGNGMKWQSMWAAVHAQFPWATLNDGYRNPAQNAAVGGVNGSYHTLGRAIDVTASADIFNWIKKNYPDSRELIYSPMGGQQLQNGSNYFWGDPVRSMHWDHVHWAMKNGGVLPGLYDNGGWLPDGGLAVNQTGKPEAVLDPNESRALKSLLSGAGLSARPAFGATAASAIQAAPQMVDNSIKIEKLEVNNPVPEELSRSLPKAIRQVGYMNEARTR